MENKLGIITILAELEEDLRSLAAELPFFSDKPVDFEGIKKQFEKVDENLVKLSDKTMMTHVLIQSVINSIHSSRVELKDSVDGLLRKTGDQLGKITATTEAATNKILDEAMKIDNDQNTIISKLDELKLSGNSPEFEEMINNIKSMIFDNQDSVFNIIQFLQFQDITAQQIKGAYALLQDTEKTLLYVSNLVKEFDIGDNDIEIVLPSSIDRNAFNADAVFSNKTSIQNAIDDLFDTGNVNVDIPADEIANSGKPTTTDNTSTSNSGGDDDDFDIDALFNTPAPADAQSDPEVTEQDDIDKLFS
jgi:chemotaxis regulatin CheY-phosphate phosphatase CheZ